MGRGTERRKERKRLQAERAQLERSLKETKAMISQAYLGFNSTADSELVEAYIFEIQALRARYSYMLRQRKALDPSAPLPGRRAAPLPPEESTPSGPLPESVLPVA